MKLIKVGLNTGALDKKQGQETAPDEIVKQLKKFY